MPCLCKTVRGVPLDMSRNHPECPDADDPDRWELPNVLARQAPDEDEEEDEGNGKDDNDHDNDDDGYSE